MVSLTAGKGFQGAAEKLKGHWLPKPRADLLPPQARDFFERWNRVSIAMTGFPLELPTYDRDGHCDFRNELQWEGFLLAMTTLQNSPLRAKETTVGLAGQNSLRLYFVNCNARIGSLLGLRRPTSYCLTAADPDDLGLRDGATTFEGLAKLVELANDVQKREGDCQKVDELVAMVRASARALEPLGGKAVGATTYAEFESELRLKICFHDVDSGSAAGSAMIWGATDKEVKVIVRKLNEFHERTAVIVQEPAAESAEAADGADTLGPQAPKVARDLIDCMRAFLKANPGKVFTRKDLNRGMREGGYTSKDYPASHISNVKRYLRDIEGLPLVGRSYCYRPDSPQDEPPA